MNVMNHVHPLQGTESTFLYSNGNTLPLISMPFGMSAWSPQTKESGDRWFFQPSHRYMDGIRLTHQPSPWIGDYGHLAFMPQSGPLHVSPAKRSSSFRPEKRTIKPDYFSVELTRYQTKLELTPTIRCAKMRINYKRKSDPARLIVSPFEGKSFMHIIPEEQKVVGYTCAHQQGAPENFALYFVLEFDCTLKTSESGLFDSQYKVMPELMESGERNGCFIGLNVPQSGIVHVNIGTSFISIEQAAANLRDEIGNRSFDTVRTEASKAWVERLGRIEILDSLSDKLDTFYTCLYRTCLFPRIWYEFDEKGKQIHYSPYDGQIYEGPMYADNGFWDTYRTLYPLLSIIAPSILSEMLEGWVNAYKEGGWMPKWASPGERSIMPGTLIDAVFADAFVKNIGGFDIHSAYEGLLKHATTASDDPHFGRPGLKDYLQLGYLPGDHYKESVNNTLDYMYGDFCIAQIAKGLGKEEDWNRLMQRSKKYPILFDKSTGFMRGLLADGNWKTPFDPLEWGGDYCEGGPWQCNWSVQHDVLGLANLFGGPKNLKERLDELMSMPPDFKIGTYPAEIHEMSEMAAIDFGQFAISNQPSFHIPYLYTAIGYPAATQYWTRRTVNELFSALPDGLPGDEDNGSLSAWYIFASLGFYPLCPGVAEYVMGSPLFERVKIKLENGRCLEINALNQDTSHPYVDSMELNGQTMNRLFVTHQELIDGAHLSFKMSDKPLDEPSEDIKLPFSLSRQHLNPN